MNQNQIEDPHAEPEIRWYCVRSKPKHEHIAAAHLRCAEGIEVFCPRLKLQRSTRRGLAWFTEALFPNYLFAKFDIAKAHAQVKYSQGVAGIVRFGKNYAPLPDTTVEDLRLFMENTELKTVPFSLTEGDTVDIVSGPFRGLNGVIKQLLPARERVKILLEFLGGANLVELELTTVFKQASSPLAIGNLK